MKGMTKKITASLLLISLAVISSVLTGMVFAVNPPIRYYGTVTLDGATATDNNNVSIWNGETLLDSVLIPSTGESGSGYYSIDLDASHTGKTLIFKVNNVNATIPTPESVTAGASGSSTNQDITASSCTSHTNCSSTDYCRYDGWCVTKLADLSNCSQKEYSGLADNNVCSGGYCYDDYSGGEEYCTNSASNCVSDESGSTAAYSNGTRSPTSTYWCGVVTSGTWTFDNPPTVSTAADLYPDSPYTTDQLACKFTAQDDHGSLKANITWYKNAVLQASLNQLQAALTNATSFDTTNVSNAVTNKTEAWSCNVTVYDTWGSTANTSDIVTVQNSIPTIDNPTISNSTPYTNDTLTCSNGSFTDNDNDAATWYYRWWKQEGGSGDFALISGETSSTLALTCSGCDESDVIKCSTIASDGTTNATDWTNSSTATIQNYNPFILSSYPILHPTTAWANNTLTCEGRAADVDDDALTLCTNFYQNGTNQTSLHNCSVVANATSLNVTVTSSNTAKNQEWKCGITVTDGTATSTESNSSAIYIKNYVPSTIIYTDMNGTNGTVWANNTLAVKVKIYDIDSGESYTLYNDLTRNGSVTTANSSTVENNTNATYYITSLTKNYAYSVASLVDDGEANSTQVYSATRYVSNYIPGIVTSSISGTNDSVYTNVSFGATFKIYDIDASETYTLSISPIKNGTNQTTLHNASQVSINTNLYFPLPTSNTAHFDAWSFTAKVSDGESDSAESTTNTRYVSNYPLSASYKRIYVEQGNTTNSTITCEYRFMDIDSGDTITAEINVYGNSTNITSAHYVRTVNNYTLYNYSLGSANTSKNNDYNCYIRGSDSYTYSDDLTTAEVYIKNYIPGIPTHTINNANSSTWTNSTITGTSKIYDIDSSETYTLCVSAYKNATNQTSLYNCTTVLNDTNTSFTVASGNTTKHELWWGSAVVSDGQGSSARTNTSHVYISNLVPEFVSAQDNVTTNEILYTGTILVTTTISDADNDTLKFYVCNNTYANSSGCINESLCSNTTSTSNPSCMFEVQDDAGLYSWYAFVFDSDNAAAVNNGDTESYNVYNTSTNLSVGSLANVYTGNYTTLWCDYELQANGSDVTDATCSISGDITNSSLIYNSTSSRYEANWTATAGTTKGAKSFTCSCNRTDYSSATNTSGSVTILNTPPTAPSLYSPSNSSRQTGNIHTLFWNSSTDDNTEDSITYYIFHSNNISSITSLGNTTGTNISSGATTDGQTYYWYVIASDGTDNSSSSGVYSYVENSKPTQPVHLSPTDGANLSGNNRSMTWSASTDSEGDTVLYYWFIGTNSTPSSSAVCSGNTTATSSGGCATNDGVTYYWSVIAGDGYENQTETTAWSFVEKYQNATVSASPASRAVIKNTAARYVLNITNIGNATDAYNMSVNTTNTTLWNYTLSSTTLNLSKSQSSTVNCTIIPNSNVTVGNYTVRVNVSLYSPGEAGTIYALTYVNVNVLANRTASTTTNFTANQTTQINLTNETSVSMDVVTNTNVTDGTVNVTQTHDNPTNASIDDTETGKYVNITADTNLTSNITYILLRIYYTEEELAYLGITNESTLTMYWYNSSSGEWVALYAGMLDENGSLWVINTSVNTTGNYIWANLTHLSVYTFGGKKANGAACTSNGQCASGICGYDHDGVGAWCVASGYCAHDGTSTTGSCSGSYRCPSSGGNWSYCSSGCSGNACITPTTITIGGGTVFGAGIMRELSLTLDRTSLELARGSSATMTATVENTGTSTEHSVALSVSGHGGLEVSVSPTEATDLASKGIQTYTVTVTVPQGAEAKTYTLTVTAESTEGTSASATLSVRVKEEVIPVDEGQAKAAITEAESTIINAESQISYYEEQGWGTTDARAALSEAGNLLVRARSSLESGDFANAKSLADQASSAASRALKLIVKPEEPEANRFVLYAIAIVAVVVILALIFFKKRL